VPETGRIEQPTLSAEAWAFGLGRRSLAAAINNIETVRARAEEIAGHARAAFQRAATPPDV
jgi:hypothetical protein